MSASPPDPAKFRLLRLLPDGTLRRGGLELLDGEGLLWLDLRAQGEPELALVGKRFGFHPLALEDCAHLDQRPKMEEYDGSLFLVQHTFSGTPRLLELHELHAFLGKDLLVTVHESPLPQLERVFERVAGEPALAARGADFLLYLVSDEIAEGHFDLLDQFAETIEQLEEAILTRLSREDVNAIFDVKRSLIELRRTLSPARDVFGLLAKRGDTRIGERTAFYFRDIYDHLVRVTETIEADRDLLGNVLEVYLTTAANRTNEIMKQLTIFSAIFLPLTFVTGFFGQNFTMMPFDRPWLLATMFGLCVALPATMLWWFMRRRWFD